MEQETDWVVLTTVNAPRWSHVTGDDLECWLSSGEGVSTLRGGRTCRGQQSLQGDVDTAALQAFFYECDLGAQLQFLRGRHISVEQALSALDRHIRPGFQKGFCFPLDAWAA